MTDFIKEQILAKLDLDESVEEILMSLSTEIKIFFKIDIYTYHSYYYLQNIHMVPPKIFRSVMSCLD
jgi:hypothetical protein